MERTLHYLPTRLTFAMIADKLGISRSVAKDRAERYYKKLGVHRHAEAVSRVESSGLSSDSRSGSAGGGDGSALGISP
jgi:hypothetical protein